MDVYLTGVHLMGVYLMGVYPMGEYLMGVHLRGVYLTGVHLKSVYLINVHLTGVRLMSVYLTGVHLMKTSRSPTLQTVVEIRVAKIRAFALVAGWSQLRSQYGGVVSDKRVLSQS
jgi:hypothetical protein